MLSRSVRAGIALVVGSLASFGLGPIRADDTAPAVRRPIKALLVTGGPFHNYRQQEKILTEGMKSRADIDWTVVNEEKNEAGSKIALFDKPNWAEGFDVVVHNECYADVDDAAYVAKLLEAHKGGVPAVVVHCAMHTFRSLKSDEWHEFLGVTTFRHGPQHPLVVKNQKPEHPIMKGFPETWTTGNEELYRIEKFWPDSVALASAEETDKKVYPVFWTHQYGKARVFGTTLPHNNKTMTDPVFLNLFARGLLWSCGRLDDSGPGKTTQTRDASKVNSPLSSYTVPGVEPRAADADAPLAEGWPKATRPGVIEIKAYPGYRGAIARGKNASLGADDVLFYPLFLHITKSNVPMTSPVLNTIDPLMIDKPGSTGDVEMEFVYRTRELGPTGRGIGAVVVEDRPASSYVCLGIQGDLEPEKIRAAVATLRAWVEDHKAEWAVDGKPRRLGYHSPMVEKDTRLWEVQISVKSLAKQ